MSCKASLDALFQGTESGVCIIYFKRSILSRFSFQNFRIFLHLLHCTIFFSKTPLNYHFLPISTPCFKVIFICYLSFFPFLYITLNYRFLANLYTTVNKPIVLDRSKQLYQEALSGGNNKHKSIYIDG